MIRKEEDKSSMISNHENIIITNNNLDIDSNVIENKINSLDEDSSTEIDNTYSENLTKEKDLRKDKKKIIKKPKMNLYKVENYNSTFGNKPKLKKQETDSLPKKIS